MGKFIKNFKNTWSIKNSKFNLSKDQIRESVVNVGRKFKYLHIFGTPVDWEFDGSIIGVKIENLSVDEMFSDNFKKFTLALIDEYQKISGKSISYKLKTIQQSYEDYQVAKFYYSTPVIELKFK